MNLQISSIHRKNGGSPVWFLEGGNIKICLQTRAAKNILSFDIFSSGHDLWSWLLMTQWLQKAWVKLSLSKSLEANRAYEPGDLRPIVQYICFKTIVYSFVSYALCWKCSRNFERFKSCRMLPGDVGIDRNFSQNPKGNGSSLNETALHCESETSRWIHYDASISPVKRPVGPWRYFW